MAEGHGDFGAVNWLIVYLGIWLFGLPKLENCVYLI